jgi:squalene-associated FAD-dependent desaturase
MSQEILIIGGGVSGLSAAVQAIEYGYKPVIVEKNKYLGGRVRSFYAKDIEQYIDNGQHVLSSAYKETFQLLEKIGSIDQIHLQPRFFVNFVQNSGKELQFKTAKLPAPFHFFLPLLRHKKFTQVNLSVFWHFFWNFITLKNEQLKELTMNEWLDICQQPEFIRELLWKPITFSVLNTPIEKASAFLLQQAVTHSFFRSQKHARLGMPVNWLGEIFAVPAEKYIKKNGGEVHLLSCVKDIKTENMQIVSLTTQKQEFRAPWIISTVPPFSLIDVMNQSQIFHLNSSIDELTKFNYHPIMTINIYLSKPLDGPFPIALISSPLHWIFTHPKQNENKAVFGYTLLISAADDWVEKSKEEILTMVQLELKRILGIDLQNDNPIMLSKIIKEKRATISQTPESIKRRMPTNTPIKNFFLAGDWIATNLPATIESAALSGKMAIDAIRRKIRNN